MTVERDRSSEKIEILCPCGHSFEAAHRPEGGEYPCPGCGRINVLPGEGRPSASHRDTKGTTTVQTAPPVLEIKPGDMTGPYRITHLIGEGGMGRVYEGVDTSLQRKVAVKILSAQLLDKKDFVARFEREARAIARLNHPNIVQIYFTGVHKGLPYYAMEMVSGGCLESLRKEGKLQSDRAAELLLQAARGLYAAFNEGVIHRDIKPSNLMLDRSGLLKITDFGLAKTVAIDSAITHTGTIIGTPYYMSPEQGEGRPLDEKTDIYSLGATFYHLLAGSPPFDADSPIGVILKHINEDLPPLRSRNRKVQKDLARIVERMMAKRPEERYQGYGELIKDLEALRKGQRPEGALARKRGAPRPAKADTAGSEVKRSTFVVLDREALERPEEIILRRCGWFRRFFALAVDYSILYLLYMLYSQGFAESAVEPRAALARDATGNAPGAEEPLWSALFLITSFLYFFLGDAGGGKTLGKILLKCRVGLDDGENMGFRRSLFRTILFIPCLMALGAIPYESSFDLKEFFLVYYAAGLEWMGPFGLTLARICFVWLVISFMFFFVTPSRSFLHDLISGSYVFAFARRSGLGKAWAPDTQARIPDQRRPSTGTEPARGPVPDASPAKGHAPLMQGGPPPVPKDWNRTAFGGDGAPALPARLAHPKNPALAMLLSFFPGLGQFYNGDIMKGLLILFTCWLIIPWALGIFDAYFTARMINRRARQAFAQQTGYPNHHL